MRKSEKKIMRGNIRELVQENPSRKGWFIGHFIKPDHPFHTKGFEVKWRELRKGWKKEGKLENDTKTLVILIEGRFRIRFKETGKSIVLSKKGDFVYYKTTPHLGEALEKTLIIVIRWPSLKL